jgi:hypothetical protein
MLHLFRGRSRPAAKRLTRDEARPIVMRDGTTLATLAEAGHSSLHCPKHSSIAIRG